MDVATEVSAESINKYTQDRSPDERGTWRYGLVFFSTKGHTSSVRSKTDGPKGAVRLTSFLGRASKFFETRSQYRRRQKKTTVEQGGGGTGRGAGWGWGATGVCGYGDNQRLNPVVLCCFCGRKRARFSPVFLPVPESVTHIIH